MAGWPDPSILAKLQAFLAMEPAQRPLLGCIIGMFMSERYPALNAALPRGPILPEDLRIDFFLQDVERRQLAHQRIGDDVPYVATPFPYVPWLEAIMGCSVVVMENSIIAEPAVHDWRAWRSQPLALDNNPWARKLLEMMAALVEHADGRYPVGQTLMRGVSDVLAALRGASRFVLDLYDSPETIHRAARLVAETFVEVAQAQLDLIPQSENGYMAAGGEQPVWAPDRIIWLQEDAMALLSPGLYREFILPADRYILSRFPFTAFHLHGSGRWSVDTLVDLPELDILELHHDNGPIDQEATFEAWRKIQQRKPLVILKEFDGDPFWGWLDRVLRELSSSGLLLHIAVPTGLDGVRVKKVLKALQG